MVNIYDTSELLGVIEETAATPPAFMLDLCFPDIIEQTTEEILWDKTPVKRGLAPFVSPGVPGKVRKQKGFRTEAFSPAYLKLKDQLLPAQHFKRRAGERPTGELSPADRRELAIADMLQDHINAVRRRKEWMAWEVAVTGSVVVSGDDYETVTVDFGRDASLTEALTGNDRFGEANFNAVTFFERKAREVQDLTGYPATTHVMDPDSWAKCRADADFLAVLDNRRQASGSVELGPVAQANGDAPPAITGSRYVGSVGDMDFYTFAGIYEDDAGNAQKYLPQYRCISVAPDAVQGAQVHGAIQDEESLEAAEFFPKMWLEKDPSATMIMTQSAPLVVPGRVNAIAATTTWSP